MRLLAMNFKDRIGYDAGATRLEDAVQTAIAHNFHYLDFNADTGPNRLDSWSNDRVTLVRNICKEHGIYLSLHTASAVNVAELSPFVDEAVDRYLRENINLSQKLNCQWVVVHGGYHFSSLVNERMAASLERLKLAVEYAEGAGVVLLLENLNREPDDAEIHYLAHTVEECRYYFDAISSENFGWAFTVNHAHLVPEDIYGFLDAFGVSRIGEVRLADNLGDKEVHLNPGKGNIDFPSMFRRLESSGFQKFYSMAFGSLEDKLAARDRFASYGF
jgi:sugar phosphate isomerase/epimerase